MKSVLFEIGPVSIYGYGLMIALGVICAFEVAERRASRYQLDPKQIYPLGFICLIGGLFGAKLLYWISIWKDIIKDPSILLDIANGFVVYGGIIFGVFAGWLFCKIRRLNFLKYFDLVMPEIALAQGFGRIGCFLAGCCYGKETNGWLHVQFPEGSLAPHGVDLIPTQLISSALDFIHFAILVILARKVKADGRIAACYLIFYSIGRYAVEQLRGDLARGSVGVFSTSQFISLFILAIGVVLYLFAGKISKKNSVTEEITKEEA